GLEGSGWGIPDDDGRLMTLPTLDIDGTRLGGADGKATATSHELERVAERRHLLDPDLGARNEAELHQAPPKGALSANLSHHHRLVQACLRQRHETKLTFIFISVKRGGACDHASPRSTHSGKWRRRIASVNCVRR